MRSIITRVLCSCYLLLKHTKEVLKSAFGVALNSAVGKQANETVHSRNTVKLWTVQIVRSRPAYKMGLFIRLQNCRNTNFRDLKGPKIAGYFFSAVLFLRRMKK